MKLHSVSMKFHYLLTLILITACSSSGPKIQETKPQQRNLAAAEVVRLAKNLVEHQAKRQPKSWDVSLEESMAKENPITPPSFVTNSGYPPGLGYAGLWNCQKLVVGNVNCGYLPRKHMIAQYISEAGGDSVMGQVAVFGAQEFMLLASCMESGQVSLHIDLPDYDNSGYAGGEIEFAFGNKLLAKYQVSFVDNYRIVIADNKAFITTLMGDIESVKMRKISAHSADAESIQFVVKNFPKAWDVACGWHAEYDASTGITQI